MRWISVLTLMALAACGADGEPTPPFGSAGISVGSGGVSTSATIGQTFGNATVQVSF